MLYTAGYFGIAYVLFDAFLHEGATEMPKEAIAIVSAVLGIMTSMLQRMGDFWFGSSAGSKSKTDALAKIVESK